MLQISNYGFRVTKAIPDIHRQFHINLIEKTKLMGAEILAANCGKTVEQVLKDFDRDYWMDAKGAVTYGIVDEVIEKL